MWVQHSAGAVASGAGWGVFGGTVGLWGDALIAVWGRHRAGPEDFPQVLLPRRPESRCGLVSFRSDIPLGGFLCSRAEGRVSGYVPGWRCGFLIAIAD